MAEEKELIKKRGSFKGRLSYFINYINTLSSYNEPLNESDKRELQLRIGKLETLYEQYDQVQLRLECLVENVEEQFKEREEFESQYYKAIAKSQGMQINNIDSEDCMGSDKCSRVSNHKLVKLPTIQLPKFSGSYDDYLEFRDTFTSLIHNNDDIDEVNKFHYLRACLEGSAAVVIQSIDFSASNYAVAWKLLCDRFDNKRLLTQNHVSALFNIEIITKESSSTLKHLIDQLNKNLRALESLGEPVKYWDTLLIYIMTNKLDQKTYREWEEYKGRIDKNHSITFDTFIQFIRNRADLIETLELSRTSQNNSSIKPAHHRVKAMISMQGNHVNQTNRKVCPKCKGDHHLTFCSQFLAHSVEDRIKLLPSYKLCFNCFHTGHFANMCKKPGCKVCRRRHNSLIHMPTEQPSPSSNAVSSNVHSISPVPSVTNHTNVALSANIANCYQKPCDVLLSTALIKVYDKFNREFVVRATLDSGSTSSLITERLFQRLQLTSNQVNTSILGINNAELLVGKTCHVHVTSLVDRFSSKLYCYILPSITSSIPSREVNISNLEIPSNISLADPTFYKPSDVDVLIGADLFWDLLGMQKINLGKNKPILCETRLGWIVSGPIYNNHSANYLNESKRCHFTQIDYRTNHECDEIRADLTRFWQLEEVGSRSSYYTPEEKMYEKHFVQNTSRQSDGRFCVRIPLKSNNFNLGDSFQRAKHCLNSLERRLKGKPDFSKLYYDFMTEYRLLGHMTECEQSDGSKVGYIIPHHGILRESSTTTKLRVVFNASSTTTSGISLNEIQMVGPTVQDDLLSILLRFRQYRFVIAADVEKMYRQIVVHPSDRHLQKILWRDSTSEPVKVFNLNTVTYGTSSAPFLATRCLKQLGMGCKNPKIAEIIQHDFYVDDLLSGGDDLLEVKMIRQEVSDVLASAGMPLRKWISNEPQLVSVDGQSPSLDLNIGLDEPNKLLGLSWHANTDVLCFPICSSVPVGHTKRDILSAIARIFDPLGLLGPYVINMKMLLQQLWFDKISWDAPLSSAIAERWKDICDMLHLLNNVRIPRIVLCNSFKLVDLHVFVDASERAYGACIYVRSINEAGEVLVRLLIAKSRVAPVKPTTIPRLELCGALTGARLYKKVSVSLRLKINKVYFWTDSTIVLGWLRMLPVKLQPFVRNRVAEIMESTDRCLWRHVPTDTNPADLISRGVDTSNLQRLEFWWNGPDFLKHNISLWPAQPKYCTSELPETRQDVSLTTIVNDVNQHKFINYLRFSNFSRLIRSIAFVLRFIRRCKRQSIDSNFLKDEELENSLNVIISDCQKESFTEYKLLRADFSIAR